MKVDCDDFRAMEDKKAKLDKRPTTIEPLYRSRKHYLKLIEKHTAGLSEQRKYWRKYQSAYEACLGVTSTHSSPWYVVPADDKQNAHLIISRIILTALREQRMSYPEPDATRRREPQLIRKRLQK